MLLAQPTLQPSSTTTPQKDGAVAKKNTITSTTVRPHRRIPPSQRLDTPARQRSCSEPGANYRAPLTAAQCRAGRGPRYPVYPAGVTAPPRRRQDQQAQTRHQQAQRTTIYPNSNATSPPTAVQWPGAEDASRPPTNALPDFSTLPAPPAPAASGTSTSIQARRPSSSDRGFEVGKNWNLRY
jgi:hypothetical protein